MKRATSIAPLDIADIRKAKRAFSTRRVDERAMRTLVSGGLRPRTGDLVLARVDRILYQTRIELPCGRKAGLHEGDTIIVAYGDRYATDQFESEVPLDLGPTNLVATGGVASRMLSRNTGVRGATEITPLGLIGDEEGRPLNLYQFRLPHHPVPAKRPPTIAVLGTSMNSGKTTTVRSLVLGLSRAGFRVGTAKVTGTGSGGDYWAMHDAGANVVADFTDAGYSATYKVPLAELESIMCDLVGHLCHEQVDVILLEIADGIFQEQNVDFIQTETFQSLVDSVFFAGGEALGAALGVCKLQMLGLDVIGLSGKLTASELLIREAAGVCEVPIYRKGDLDDPLRAPHVLGIEPKQSPSEALAMTADEMLLIGQAIG
nr:DUF1611 domain-containing protein [uncultured Sphingomonas sp.]